jgi:hypothetical protein
MPAPPASTDAIPRARSPIPWNPAVPPPPVGGAAVGKDELVAGDGDGPRDRLAPGRTVAVAFTVGEGEAGVAEKTIVGAAVVCGGVVAGEPARAVPLNSAVDEGDTEAVDPTVGRGDPEPVQPLRAADATTASKAQPIRPNVRIPNRTSKNARRSQAVLSLSR